MDNYKHIEKQIHELQEKRRTLAVQIGIMATTPNTYGDYSGSKPEDMQRHAAKMDEQI